jgi:hypothetical protein
LGKLFPYHIVTLIEVFPSLQTLLKIPDKARLNSEEVVVVRGAMRDLRSAGFSNKEISRLTKERWKENTVKKYTSGVKVQSTATKDRVLDMVRELVEKEKSIQDVVDYHTFNQLLDNNNIPFEALFNFYNATISKEIDAASLVRLHHDLQESKRTLPDLISDLDREKELISKDLTIENMEQMHKTVTKYSGFQETMKVLNTINDIIEALQMKTKTEEELSILNQEKQGLENENERLKLLNNTLGIYSLYAQNLLLAGYDISSLHALKNLADKYGGPETLYQSIGEYEGLVSIQQRKENLREINKRLDDEKKKKAAELAASEEFIEKANQMIGAIEANQKKALEAQIIYEIMSDPENLEIENSKFKRIFLHILLGVRQYAKRADIEGWQNLRYYLSSLIDGLTRIT